MKRKSLRNSIITSSIGVLAIAVVLVAAVFSTSMNVKMFGLIKQDYYNQVAAESNEMKSWITKHNTIAESLSLSAVASDLHGDALKEYLNTSVMAVSDSILDCYVAWEEEAPLLIAANFVPGDDYVPQQRGWYKQAVAEGKAILTDPYIDAFTGKIVVTIANPIKKNGQIVGCCGLDIEITELVNLTNSLKMDTKGYAILVDASDNIVIHTANSEFNHQLVGSEEKVTSLTDTAAIYSSVIADIKDSGSSAIDLSKGNIVKSAPDYDNVNRFYPAVSLGESNWKVIYAADYNEAFTAIVTNIILIVILGVGSIIVGTLFLYIKFNKRLKPLASIEGIVEEMAHGQLEHNYPKVINDDIGAVSETLKETNSSLKEYVDEIGRCLSCMSNGDFTVTSNVDFVGEFTAIGESLETIKNALAGTFTQINSATVQISGGSSGVASGATGLAGAVSQETSIINEVVNDVEDIAEKVAQSAENASSAKNETISTASIVNESNAKMDELLSAMTEIAVSAESIVKINTTIEDIAFQTNILALNASVEAARAGDAGKGFAVVADEVRNLASKSGEASSSTNKLINETVNVINKGKKLANETADLLAAVVERTKVIESSVTDISEVTEKQKAQLQSIVNKLSEVSGVVQTTAATAEESAAASEELDSQVEMLKESLRKYIV